MVIANYGSTLINYPLACRTIIKNHDNFVKNAFNLQEFIVNILVSENTLSGNVLKKIVSLQK